LKSLFLFGLMVPISFTLLSIEAKPVDVVPSDLLLLLLPIFLLHKGRVTLPASVGRRLSMLFFFVFFFLIWCISSMTFQVFESGSLSAVASAMKFLKPIVFFIILFTVLGRAGQTVFRLHHFHLACLLYSYTFFISSFQAPGFPSSKWGQFFLGQPAYGFPNSPMTFLACLLPFSLSSFYEARSRLWRIGSLASILITCTTVTLSLSRSSFVVLGLSAILWFYISFGRLSLYRLIFRMVRFVVPVSLLVFLCVIFLSLFFDMTPQADRIGLMLESRVGRTFQSEDTFSGRQVLWADTVSLILERPIGGYGFKSFSSFAETFDTPHQQYLEIAYKVGIVGLLLFLTCFYQIFSFIRHFSGSGENRKLLSCYFAGIAAVAVGNFTQPNYTYSVTGNFYAFLSVCVLGGCCLNVYQMRVGRR